MKKIVLTLAALLIFSTSAAFAAPVNDLSRGQTALGLGSDTFYLEHKLTDTFTLGFQDADWVRGNDIYGQFRFTDSLSGIVGSRNLDSDSNLYFGLAVNGPLSPGWNGYASFVAGGEFNELQAGASYRLSHNLDLNLSYHSFMPDAGANKNGVGIGATLKF